MGGVEQRAERGGVAALKGLYGGGGAPGLGNHMAEPPRQRGGQPAGGREEFLAGAVCDQLRIALRRRKQIPGEAERLPRLPDPFVENGAGGASLVGAPAAVGDEQAEPGRVHGDRSPAGRLEREVEGMSGDGGEADGLVHGAALDGDSVLRGGEIEGEAHRFRLR